MSSKSKLIIAIVMIVAGAGLVPTGLVTNNYMRDQVYDGVPDALLGIKAEAIPGVEELLPLLGAPEVLKGVFDEAALQLEPMLTVSSTPLTLLGLRSEINGSIPDLIDGVTTANIIATSLAWAESTYGAGNGTEYLFNDIYYIDAWVGLIGVTNFFNSSIFPIANLSYTPTAQDRLLNTGFFDSFINDYYSEWFSVPVPGLISDLDMGTGVNGYNSYYWTADYFTNVLADTVPAAAMESGYNATWSWQLTAIAYWLDMIINYYVPGVFYATYGITVQDMQWANGTLIPDGVDLGGFKGYEAGLPDPTNISLSTSRDLWNPLNPLSFTNDDGIWVWVGAMEGNATLQGLLMSTFSLTVGQLTILLTWLGNFIENITPALVFSSTGKTINQLSTLALHEQWANGTIFGDVVLLGGFLGEVNPSWAGAPYFEVGLPIASNLSLAKSLKLWDPLLDKTFTYADSFQDLWLPAMLGDSASLASLMAIFSLTVGELTQLLTWLGSLIGLDPLVGRIADLIEYNTGLTLTQIATSYFYEQWANGTVGGDVILPDGFLSELDPPILGPPYFELGLMYPAGITTAQALALWDENSEYSLVTVSGVNNWYLAVEGNDIYTTLKAQNDNLNDLQMTAILAWLPQFRDVIVNILAQDSMGLPQEPYDLGQTLALSLGWGGGGLAALGVLVLILSRRK
ncbi:MAG: hypothetical protein ACTSR5_15740 [Promethearchaeota archaeon]